MPLYSLPLQDRMPLEPYFPLSSSATQSSKDYSNIGTYLYQILTYVLHGLMVFWMLEVGGGAEKAQAELRSESLSLALFGSASLSVILMEVEISANLINMLTQM